jgi:hypothetical protein
VTIDGNVTVNGSNNRFRGALVTGDLDVPGSGATVLGNAGLPPIDSSAGGC